MRMYTAIASLVPGRGLEPLRIAPPDPKSGASANFATLAKSALALAQTLVQFPTARDHLVILTLNVTVLSPPAFVMTNLHFPSFVGVTFTEHFGPGETSLPTSLPASSYTNRFTPTVDASRARERAGGADGSGGPWAAKAGRFRDCSGSMPSTCRQLPGASLGRTPDC